MDSKDSLIDLWSKVNPLPGYEYSYKKIDDKSITDLNVGISSSGEKCLVLVLPKNFSNNVHISRLSSGIERLNIVLFLHEERELILLLKDNFYFETFLDFVDTLLPKILVSDELTSPFIFLQTIQDWLKFFEHSGKKGLSDESVLGLLAELRILQKIIDNSNFSVNSALEGWRGPYHYSKDFELDDRYVEVKYKSLDQSNVSISSEFQLNSDNGKPTHLSVVTGELDQMKGITLSDLNQEIRLSIRREKGDMAIYLKALGQVGVTISNISSYDHIKVIFSNIQTFDASMNDFPCIQKQHLKKAISKVSYKIDVSKLDHFLIEKDFI